MKFLLWINNERGLRSLLDLDPEVDKVDGEFLTTSELVRRYYDEYLKKDDDLYTHVQYVSNKNAKKEIKNIYGF